MEIGIDSFVETTPDVLTGKTISHAERLRQVVEEIVLADKVGLEYSGSASITAKVADSSSASNSRRQRHPERPGYG